LVAFLPVRGPVLAWISPPKIKFGGHLAMGAFWRSWRISSNFFIWMPPKALPGAGLGGRISQNIVVKELRYQNIESKRLRLG
jgi:hypothetical protein